MPGKVEDGGEFPLQKALDVLKSCDGCDSSNGVGLICGYIFLLKLQARCSSIQRTIICDEMPAIDQMLTTSTAYLPRLPYYVEEAAFLSPEIKALVSYGGRKFTTLNESAVATPPQLIHIAGPDAPRRESFSVAPDASARLPPSGIIKSYRYEDAKKESNWALPSDEEYHKRSAGIAHTRSLTFLKPLLNGPFFDLEAIWEEHCKFEFAERDVEKTMATMVDQPYVNHIPTMTFVLAFVINPLHCSTIY